MNILDLNQKIDYEKGVGELSEHYYKVMAHV